MRGTRLLIAGVLLVGCSFDQGGVEGISDGGVSGGPDAPASADADPGAVDAQNNQGDGAPESIDASTCVGDNLTVPFSNLASCSIPAPAGALNLDDDQIWILNTNNGELQGADDDTTIALSHGLVAQLGGGPMVRVVTVTDLVIGANVALAAIGDHPIVLVATGDAIIDGLFYAGAAGAVSGPGGNAAECGAGTGTDGAIVTGAGSGGGGGAYGSGGGNGATSSTDTSGNATPVAGGSVNGDTSLTPLRGGCSGGAGGNNGGPGGGGGGAVQLIVEGSLIVNGRMTARGGGGLQPQPADNQPGAAAGGGGGSGGAILLEANNLTITDGAMLLSQGGGGGEGTRSGGVTYAANAGENGHSGDANPAIGGGPAIGMEPASNSAGGDGGNGAVEGIPATSGALGTSGIGGDAGGGGGGGGVGRIHLSSPALTVSASALISPAAQ